jgi:hypothetical protein
MRKAQPSITASEVGEFMFCAKAWQLKREGAEAASPHLAAGIAFHRQHGRQLRFARTLRRAAWVCAGLALLALLYWKLQ